LISRKYQSRPPLGIKKGVMPVLWIIPPVELHPFFHQEPLSRISLLLREHFRKL